MLKTRIVTAAVLIPIVIYSLFLAPMFIFNLLLGFVFILACWEWGGFLDIKKNKNIKKLSLVVFYCIVALACILWLQKYDVYILFLAVLFWVFSSILVFYFNSFKNYITNKLKVFMGLFILIPFILAFLILKKQLDGNSLILYSLCLIWLADSGAYFSGRVFGKHKLAPSVSPGKSWEGVLGGLMLSILLAVLIIPYFKINNSMAWISLSLLTVFISIIGDLTESMFKRIAGIKDSGKILPGHGGILDRIDSLTAALPVFTFGLYLLGLIH